jgi:hypothetical protein
MRNKLSLLLLVQLILAVPFSFSQATRTWVSGVGDDMNPCSRTAPCKTLAGAISKTAVGGEISILDPGGFGSVTITKSITIDGGGIIGSILASGTNGIIIDAPGGLVTIRNFSINGAGTTMGTNGIRVRDVKKLFIENCNVANFGGNAIDIDVTAAADIVISHVSTQNAANGISINNPGFAVIDHCNAFGMGNAGLSATNSKVTLSNTMISACLVGVNSKPGSFIYLSGNTITNNGTALQGPGTFNSMGNNSVFGNKTQGSSPVEDKQQ